ncbi:MAG: putative sulfate exporter family transporter [Gaiellales bacterium]
MASPERPEARSPATARIATLIPGVALAALIAAVATVFGKLVPVVGAPVFAIVAGIVISTLRPPSARLRPGIAFCGKRVLQGSIAVLGLQLSVRQVLSIGQSSLPVLLGTILIVLALAAVLGPLLRLRSDVTTLIGVGTAICGASAIAATSAVIDAAEADVSYAIATIFTFNVVAVLIYPTLGHAFGLSQHAFGVWAGTAINDTSSVVAASTIYGHAATSYGVTVKLTRTLAIIPICLALAARRNRRVEPDSARPGSATRARRVTLLTIFPLFIVGFVAAAILNTAGLVPDGWHHDLSDLASWMIAAALAAIGLSTRFRDIRRAGARPIVLGAILWATIGVSSLLLQAATGNL